MKRNDSFQGLARLRGQLALLALGFVVQLHAGVGTAASALAETPDAQAKGDGTAEVDTAEVDKTPEVQAERDRIFSGPQPGEKVAPFKVLRFKDGTADEVEIVKEGKGTTLICFVHKLSPDDRILYGLPLVDFYTSRQKDLSSHYVLLSDDRAKMLKMLGAWSRASLFKASEVSLSVDGVEGPGFYGLNRQIAMTVLVAKDGKVVKNMALAAPNGKDLESIMVAVAETLDKPKPTLAQVQQELRAERQKELDKRMKASPVFKIAPNEELGRIMFGLVNGRGNQTLIAKRRSKQFRDWVGDDKQRESELKKYCQAVLAGEFKLNRYTKSALEELAGD